jgi:hypothetical protein
VSQPVPPFAIRSENLQAMPEGVVKVIDLIAARVDLQTPHPSTAGHVRGGRTVLANSSCRCSPPKVVGSTADAPFTSEGHERLGCGRA